MLDELDDKGLLRVAQTLREGVHLATPVFDGAKEIDIKALLTQAEHGDATGRRRCSTARPARRSTTTSPSASCTC